MELVSLSSIVMFFATIRMSWGSKMPFVRVNRGETTTGKSRIAQLRAGDRKMQSIRIQRGFEGAGGPGVVVSPSQVLHALGHRRRGHLISMLKSLEESLKPSLLNDETVLTYSRLEPF